MKLLRCYSFTIIHTDLSLLTKEIQKVVSVRQEPKAVYSKEKNLLFGTLQEVQKINEKVCSGSVQKRNPSLLYYFPHIAPLSEFTHRTQIINQEALLAVCS